MNEWLAAIGIKLDILIAGLAGGIVHAFLFTKTKPLEAVGSVVVGTLTAAYLTEVAVSPLGLSGPKALPAAGFIVGLTAILICNGLVNAVRAWKPGDSKRDNPNA